MSAMQRGCASRSDASAGMDGVRPRPPASARLLTSRAPARRRFGLSRMPAEGSKGDRIFFIADLDRSPRAVYGGVHGSKKFASADFWEPFTEDARLGPVHQYSCSWALRKQDYGGRAPFLTREVAVSSAAPRPGAPFLTSCVGNRSAPSTLRTRRVTDKRVKRGGQQCNFYIYYEVDDEEYEDEAEYGWVLLAAAPEAAAVGRRVRAGAAGVRSTVS